MRVGGGGRGRSRLKPYKQINSDPLGRNSYPIQSFLQGFCLNNCFSFVLSGGLYVGCLAEDVLLWFGFGTFANGGGKG